LRNSQSILDKVFKGKRLKKKEQKHSHILKNVRILSEAKSGELMRNPDSRAAFGCSLQSR